MTQLEDVGVVVIGRNEGTRLAECLNSLGWTHRIVYADSVSSDGSADRAAADGFNVLLLSGDQPFTAARGRAEGLNRLLQLWPQTQFVLFVDGDCVVEQGWLNPALQMLESEADLAVVCGLRREAFPEASVYNRIMDMEWAAPAGEIESCGGDALMKVSLIAEAGGFNPAVIAGEEPELCFRIRQRGYRIYRLREPMTIHDARMKSIGQWCRREKRSGLGSYNVWKRCGADRNAPFSHLVRSAVLWGLAIPICGVSFLLVGLLLHLPVLPVAMGLGSLYVLQMCRIGRRGLHRGLSCSDAMAYGGLCMFGKFCQSAGIVRSAFFTHSDSIPSQHNDSQSSKTSLPHAG